MSTRDTTASRTSTVNHAASVSSNVASAVRCTTQLACGHTWQRSTPWNLCTTKHAKDRAQKLHCDAARELNPKNTCGTSTTRTRASSKSGVRHRPVLRAHRANQKSATIRKGAAKLCRKCGAKWSASLRPTSSQEMFVGRQCTGPGARWHMGREHMLLRNGRAGCTLLLNLRVRACVRVCNAYQAHCLVCLHCWIPIDIFPELMFPHSGCMRHILLLPLCVCVFCYAGKAFFPTASPGNP